MMLFSLFIRKWTVSFFSFFRFDFGLFFLHNTYQYHGLEWRRNVCIKMRTEKNMLIFGEWFFCHLAWCIFRSNWKHDLERSEINPHFVKWTNALPFFACRTINSPLLIHLVFTFEYYFVCTFLRFNFLITDICARIETKWILRRLCLRILHILKHNKLKQYWLWCSWDIVIFSLTSCTVTSDKIW